MDKCKFSENQVKFIDHVATETTDHGQGPFLCRDKLSLVHVK